MAAAGAWWPEAHCDPAAMAALADAARSVLGFEMLRVPFDQTVEAELLGAAVARGDRVSNCSLRSQPFALTDPAPAVPGFDSGRARVVTEAIAILKQRAGEAAAVIGGIVGPFTLACQLAGLAEVLMAAARRPDAVRPWLDFAVEAGIAYARRQVAAGADAICVDDMGASLELTSPALHRDLIVPAQQRLIGGIGAPVILHICGSNTRILELLGQSGAAALSLESKTDLARAVALNAGAVIGGVDPVGALFGGTPAEARRASLESLRAGVHILAPGCGLPAGAPTANLREMVGAAREWRG
jgi:[methyl-Co(III) methanol-specific corrinoid protein]:coenzyme M methyltransferase